MKIDVIKPRLVKARSTHYYGQHGYFATFMFDDYRTDSSLRVLRRILNENFGEGNSFGYERLDRRWSYRSGSRVQLTNHIQHQVGIRHEHDVTLLMLHLSAEGLLDKFDIKLKVR